jgi:hypothetical protein
MIYFVPETEQSLTAIGLRPGRMCYFAGRAAPMGPVGPGTVAATFYNFSPEIVARHIPRAWTLASPDRVIVARFEAVDAALRRLLGDAATGPEVEELADLTRTAAAGCSPEGRPLYAAHADLDVPAEPHLALWHAISLLREHRGDGHIAALLRAGLDALAALITHTATGRGFTPSAAQATRGWSAEQWDRRVSELTDAGLLTDAGDLTDEGERLRAQVETDTDAMAAAPWRHLGPDGTARVVELGKGLSRRISEAGAFPAGLFGR